MKKLLKNNHLKTFLFLIMPLMTFADPFEDGIEPPPTAPIDNATLYLAILGVVFAAYYIYTTKLKLQKK